MSTTEYYSKKKEINNNDSLSNHQKNVLITDLRHEYIGVDRSGLTKLDTVNLKPAIIKVIDN